MTQNWFIDILSHNKHTQHTHTHNNNNNTQQLKLSWS